MLFTELGDYADSSDRILESKYARAEACLTNGEYDSAYALFNELGDYSDAADRILESKYERAEVCLTNGEYDSAYALFNELGDYSDAADRILESKYERACAALQQGSFAAAQELFTELGDYSDAAAQLASVEAARLQAAYDDALARLALGKYDEAYRILGELGDYADAAQQITASKQQRAETLLAQGQYGHAYVLLDELGQHDRVLQNKLERARICLNAGDFDGAEALLGELGQYEGAEALLAKVNEGRKRAQADSCLNAGEYEAARALYLQLGDAAAANESLYLLAHTQENATPWLAYDSYTALGAYRDSADRAAALYTVRFETIDESDANGLRRYYDHNAAAYGLLDAAADVAVPAEYEKLELTPFNTYYAVRDQKMGLLSADGSVLVQTAYEGIITMDDAHYLVWTDQGDGVLAADGSVVVECAYDSVEPYENGGYLVKKDSLLGLLDSAGSLIVPVEYSRISVKGSGFDVVKDYKHGILDGSGQTILQPLYDSIDLQSDGRYQVVQNKKYGIADAKGSSIIAPAYNTITLDTSGNYIVTSGGKYGIVSYEGKVLHYPDLQEIRKGSNDGKYLIFRKNNLYGFMDAVTFETVIEAEWKNVHIMYDGYAYIYNNLNKWGVISEEGVVTVTPAWTDIVYYDDCGHAVKDENILLNNRGNTVCDFSKAPSKYYYSRDPVKYQGKGIFTDGNYDTMLYDTKNGKLYSYEVNNDDVKDLRMLGGGLLSGKANTGRYGSGNDYYCVIDPATKTILTGTQWEDSITSLPCRNQVNDKYGWISEKGTDLIRPTYNYIRRSTVNGYIIAANYNDRGNLVYVLIDGTTGKVVKFNIGSEDDAVSMAMSMRSL